MQRPHIVEVEPFGITFGPKAQRKRPRLDIGSIEELGESFTLPDSSTPAGLLPFLSSMILTIQSSTTKPIQIIHIIQRLLPLANRSMQKVHPAVSGESCTKFSIRQMWLSTYLTPEIRWVRGANLSSSICGRRRRTSIWCMS